MRWHASNGWGCIPGHLDAGSKREWGHLAAGRERRAVCLCITLLLVVEIEVAEVAQVAVRDMRCDSVRGRLPQPRGG